jgi:hypothetical protein
MPPETQAAAPAAHPMASPPVSVEQGVDILMARLMATDTGAPDAAQEPQAAQPEVGQEGQEPKTDEAPADYLEFDGPDGQPQRIALDEAIAAYTERGDLSRKVQELTQAQQAMPQELEQALVAVAQTRQVLINEAQQLQRVYQPQPPSRDMVNPQSPNYNPEQYHAQLQDYERGQAYLARLKEQEIAQRQALEQEQQQLNQAVITRGRAQLQQLWPEVLSDQSVRQELAQMLSHVGFDANILSTVTDPRAYLVMKYAMQGLKAEAAAKGQLKSVRTMPRLVKSAGRTNPRANDTQMAKLKQTGSLEDALPLVMQYLTR